MDQILFLVDSKVLDAWQMEKAPQMVATILMTGMRTLFILED